MSVKEKKNEVSARCLFIFPLIICCAVQADDLAMSADTEIHVASGETNVIDTLSGAYTLTKTGPGLLEIRRLETATMKLDVREGGIRLTNPRPDGIFRKSYFHVDASDLSSMVIENVNGTNFVSRWNDTDGGEHYAVNCTTEWYCRKDPENRKPFLRENFQNGLPVVDFGTLLTRFTTNEFGVALGHGAAMTFDKETPDVKEGFTVASDTDDYIDGYERWQSMGLNVSSIYGMSFFSHGTTYRFVRHEFEGEASLGVFCDNARNNDYFREPETGWYGVWYDGVQLKSHPKWTTPSPGFHTYRIRPAAPGGATYENFAAEFMGSNNGGNRSYGGQRIAEYVLFTDAALTDQEASEVHRYLRVKWFPQKAASVTVGPDASFTVDPGIRLDAPLVNYGGFELALSEGCSHVFDTLLDAPSSIHLDASRLDTMTLVPSNGTNFVTRWNDVRGTGKYAASDTGTGRWEQRTDPDGRRPFINPALTQNGLPVVDLGSAIFTGHTNAQGVAIGYGGAFKLSSNHSVAEYLAVISDTEDLKTAPVNKDGPSYISYKSSNSYSGVNVGRRGYTVAGKNPPLFYKVSSDGNAKMIKGTNLVNGVEQKYTYNPPDGFNVINLRPTSAAANCNLIGRTVRTDTTTTHDTFGGQRIAEYMLFSELLSEVQRDRIYAALRVKWYGEGRRTRIYHALTIPAGASLTVPWESIAVTNRLAISGSLAAPSVRAAAVDVTGASRIEAPLTLPDGATLSFTRCPDGTWPVLEASSLELEGTVAVVVRASTTRDLNDASALLVKSPSAPVSLEGWSVKAETGKMRPVLSLGPEGVSVSFHNPKMVIVIR